MDKARKGIIRYARARKHTRKEKDKARKHTQKKMNKTRKRII